MRSDQNSWEGVKYTSPPTKKQSHYQFKRFLGWNTIWVLFRKYHLTVSENNCVCTQVENYLTSLKAKALAVYQNGRGKDRIREETQGKSKSQPATPSWIKQRLPDEAGSNVLAYNWLEEWAELQRFSG